MNNTHEALWNKYSEAWAPVAPEKRKELLTQAVSGSCSFADPDTEAFGLVALTAHIDKFQEQFPGAYFETRRFIEHHGQSVAEWMMHNKDGSEFLPGISVARYGEDGKMAISPDFGGCEIVAGCRASTGTRQPSIQFAERASIKRVSGVYQDLFAFLI